MRASIFPLVAILGFTAWGLAMPAGAQVSVNLDALNPSAGNPPAAGRTPQANRPARPAARPATQPAARPAARPATQPAARRPGTPAQPAPGAPAAPASGGTGTAVGTAAGAAAVGGAILALPAAPPENPVIAPLVPPPAPAAAVQPPQRPATSATAGSATAATPEGLRVKFATGKSDLTPESSAALTAFAKRVPAGEGVSLNVLAFAAGTPEDPSTARRLSLARALTIRSALMADGIASTRIYVRAMGAPASGTNGVDAGPLDRVDIAILGTSSVQAGVPAGVPAGAPAPGRP